MNDEDYDFWFWHSYWAVPTLFFLIFLGLSIPAYFYLDATRPERERALRVSCASFCEGSSFMLHRSGECVCVITPESAR